MKRLAIAAVVAACALAGPAFAALTDPLPVNIQPGSIHVGLQTVLTGLTSPTQFVDAADGSGDMYLVDQTGTITRVTPGGGMQTVLNISNRLVSLNPGYDERGLLGFAVDPGYATNKTVYTYTSESPSSGPADYLLPPDTGAGTVSSHGVLAAWTVNPATGLIDPASRRQILSVEHPEANHNGGKIAFGPDGMLYMGIGDGGNANDVGFGHVTNVGNAQTTSTLMGKILRIDPHGTNGINGQYGTPADNPFASGGGLPEIFATGFRNPFSFSFDNRPGGTGQLIGGDVGQNNVEEVDLVTNGGNYGWHIKEGTFTFDPATGDVLANSPGSPAGLTDPVAEYDHDDGIAIVGGFVYRGSAIPQLDGMYVFGDLSKGFVTPAGRLFYTDLNAADPGFGVIQELQLASPLGLFIKGFGEDAGGNLYVLGSTSIGPSGSGGEVLRIVAVPEPASLGILFAGAWGLLRRSRARR